MPAEQMSDTPVVSIVIPTLGRADALDRCLQSIRNTVHLPHEVICVTVGNDEPTQSLLRTSYPHASNIVQPDPLGFVRAVNAGFQAAAGSYLLYINDDTRLLPHSVGNAVRFIEAPAHGDVGLVAFHHDSPVTRNIHSQVQLDGRWFYVCHVRGLCYANFGLGRRSLFEQLDWFDERYRMYGADPDFSLKVWHEAQLRVAPCPGALIEHDEVADDRATIDRAAQASDNALLFEKWNL